MEYVCFKGLNNFKSLSFFGSLTTRKNENVTQNRGDNIFKKMGFFYKIFQKFYLLTNTKFLAPLKDLKKI